MRIRAEYGVDRVNLVGHSLGITVYLNDTQTHIEAATSPESFAAQFRFFTGDDPRTTLILPEPPGQVQVAGRAVYFPQNSGVDGAMLRIWEVDGATGARKYAEPLATLDIGPSGNFGPVNVNGQQHYEFELTRPDNAIVQHIYYQPFIRDDYWARLLSSLPTSGITLNTVIAPNHAAAVVTRIKEWWTVHPGGGMDVLDISTASRGRGDQPPANALENVIGGAIGSIGTSAIGIHAHDNRPTA